MNARIFRVGRLVASERAGRAGIELSNPCQSCSATCLSGRASVAEPLELADTVVFSGKVGQPVTISVSRSGLTLASFYAFAPVLLVLGVVAVIIEIASPVVEPGAGVSAGFASIALSALCLAVYLSRALLKQSAPRLLDIQATLPVSPARNCTEFDRERDQKRIATAQRGKQ